MKRCSAFGGLAAASLLLPGWAAAESHLERGSGGAKLSATAHVDFKIIIPQVLALGIEEGIAVDAAAQRVTIFSNSRTVSLSASLSSASPAHDSLLFRAAARRVIAREAACRLPAVAAGITTAAICTVAMP